MNAEDHEALLHNAYLPQIFTYQMIPFSAAPPSKPAPCPEYDPISTQMATVQIQTPRLPDQEGKLDMTEATKTVPTDNNLPKATGRNSNRAAPDAQEATARNRTAQSLPEQEA